MKKRTVLQTLVIIFTFSGGMLQEYYIQQIKQNKTLNR